MQYACNIFVRVDFEDAMYTLDQLIADKGSLLLMTGWQPTSQRGGEN